MPRLTLYKESLNLLNKQNEGPLLRAKFQPIGATVRV